MSRFEDCFANSSSAQSLSEKTIASARPRIALGFWSVGKNWTCYLGVASGIAAGLGHQSYHGLFRFYGGNPPKPFSQPFSAQSGSTMPVVTVPENPND
jgi:hypothetical protein